MNQCVAMAHNGKKMQINVAKRRKSVGYPFESSAAEKMIPARPPADAKKHQSYAEPPKVRAA